MAIARSSRSPTCCANTARGVDVAARIGGDEFAVLLSDTRDGSTPPESLFEWGIESVWIEETRVRIADPARTVIDVLDEPRLGGGIRHGAEILNEYLTAHDSGTLIDYGDRLGNRAVFERLGYLVVASGEHHDDLVAACQARISSGISSLDPGGPDGGVRVAEWGLRINARIGPAEAS